MILNEHAYGIAGTIIFLLDLFAIISILGSNKSTLDKLIWIVLIILLPLVGFLIWFFIGPRSQRT